MKQLFSIVLLLLALSCSQTGPRVNPITPQQIEAAIAGGSFTKAESMIKDYLYQNNLSVKERQKWLFQIEKMNRIRMDFTATDSSVISYLLNYYDSVPAHQLRVWEEGKALEYMTIDGEKRYFRWAARNLFRISLAAKNRWEEVHGNKPDSLARFLAHYIPEVVNVPQKQLHNLTNPVTMEVTYTLTVKPNAVPGGEWVRVWMPLPRTDHPRQSEFQLISANQPYMLSPDNLLYAHKSIYMEKRAVIDEPITFQYTFSYTSCAEWFNFDPADLKMYDTQSEIYQTYTSEQAPHILFTDKIKKITQDVVGNEQNPYLKVRKIYNWIDKNFPWASSREYSTLDNIPEYVLDNRHGDCGQVSLLFITMARCAGVPAKWQSGWMMHPGNKNLHDWAEVFYEGIGWVPVDQSFGRVRSSQNPDVYWFYTKGIDAFRMVVNEDIGRDFYPIKIHPRSETVDFQRGEVEWRGGNLYFNQWSYNMDITYKPAATLVKDADKSTKGTADLRLPGYGYRRADEAWYYTPNSEGSLNANRTSNQRSYDRYQSSYYYPGEQALAPQMQNDPNAYSPYYPYPSTQDYSVSEEYSYMRGLRSSEDRYVSPAERSPLPGNNQSLPYRRDLQGDQFDPRSILPSQYDAGRYNGAPVTPYPNNNYRR